ncbi:hypothetical protein ECZU31_17550 [Escherichia coli]|nr:hypothetical protein ECZU31_17550 [Escherichia coli]
MVSTTEVDFTKSIPRENWSNVRRSIGGVFQTEATNASGFGSITSDKNLAVDIVK